MILKAVLRIKAGGSYNKTLAYRIQSDQNEIKDISIESIKQVLSKGYQIQNLKIKNNELIETTEILTLCKIGYVKQSLKEWCDMNGERGQRIIKEFNGGNNFPFTIDDFSYRSNKRVKFQCQQCKRINVQPIRVKTSDADCKCKYCAGQAQETSLLDWCNTHGTYGAQLIQEFIAGDNNFSPDQVSYASHKYANFKCHKCGEINRQIISSKTSKNLIGCRYCDKTKTSIGEQLIFVWLQSQGVQVYNQYKFRTPLGTKEFDIYMPQLNLAIEHQSDLHRTLNENMNDQRTELISQNLGINLLEICLISSQYERIESNWCLTYKKRHEQEMIDKLSNWINTNYGLNTNPAYSRALEDQAYLNSCKVKYEKSLEYFNPPFLKEWNKQLNGAITPDKVANNSSRKYYWTCPICGLNYLSTPEHRNKGQACPNWRNHKKHNERKNKKAWKL